MIVFLIWLSTTVSADYYFNTPGLPDIPFAGRITREFSDIKKLSIYNEPGDEERGIPPFAVIKDKYLYLNDKRLCRLNYFSACKEYFHLEMTTSGSGTLWLPFFDWRVVAGERWYLIRLAVSETGEGWISEKEVPGAKTVDEILKTTDRRLVFTQSLYNTLIYSHPTSSNPARIAENRDWFMCRGCCYPRDGHDYIKVSKIVRHKHEKFVQIKYDIYVYDRGLKGEEAPLPERLRGSGWIKLIKGGFRLNILEDSASCG